MNKVTKSPKETQEIAISLSKKIKKGGVVCLFGNLGTGKTIFTKGLAEGLGIENLSIKSPTYTYIRHHKIKDQNVYHIDLYRLKQIDELLALELNEIMHNKKNIIIIEWADRMESILPKKRIDVELEYLDDDSREIKITEHE
ncbi:tRNA (adenosine(37)-N6)-threonylcarbamoyltransferase complex ATPase subunit type 1 TsaE [Candidatus Peregrinibacteria bacterium CG_4_10_14_0_2_um_filter_38_24]|nr:MAG: tRNA (adenosine(37)-N6)-threonylcarbamoyltransferase complex ATPase subunit type 1 TsaE [Candidatus Peregrinibacteria bacterium CG_4_10_14_0_2_um_filter_38_24]